MPLTLMAEKNTIKYRFGFENTILAGDRIINNWDTPF